MQRFIIFVCLYLLYWGTFSFQCSSNLDCSLLGICDRKTKVCTCDKGWKGDRCDLPALASAPIAPAFGPPNRSSWGGRPIKINGSYHLFVSDVGPCGLHQFKYFSRIVHAKADKPEGPYTYQSLVVDTVAHNSYPLVSSDGKYILIYYIGLRMDPKSWNCTAHQKPVPKNLTSIINVAYSSTGPHGPWKIITDIFPLKNRPFDWVAGGVSNPGVTILPNGTALLAFHGKTKDGEAPGIARAESWRGPFTLFNPNPIFKGTDFHGEDFFLWQDKRGAFHIIFHDKEPFGDQPGGPSHKVTGGLAYSEDGFNWHPCPDMTYDGNITWQQGTGPDIFSRQRPLLFFDNDQEPDRPTHLFNGVQENNGNDYSWLMVQPFSE